MPRSGQIVTPRPKVIGVVGSRRRNTGNDLVDLLVAFDREYCEGDTLVSGGCEKGGDSFAYSIAKARGLTLTIHFPDWSKHGKAAGFVRNTKIAEDADVLIALVAADRTGGTEDTVKKALRMGKRVVYA